MTLCPRCHMPAPPSWFVGKNGRATRWCSWCRAKGRRTSALYYERHTEQCLARQAIYDQEHGQENNAYKNLYAKARRRGYRSITDYLAEEQLA